MNAHLTSADYATPAIRIIRICSMLLGMTLVAAAFAAILTGILANNSDSRSDTGTVGLAIGALIIGTPIVLIANIWTNLYARERVFPVYVVSWIAMLVIAFVAVRTAESNVSTTLVIVFAAPGLIILPVQVFLLRLGKRFANGWPFTGGRSVSSGTAAPYVAFDQSPTGQGQSDTTLRQHDHPYGENDSPNGDGNWQSERGTTPDVGGSGSSDSGSSSSRDGAGGSS